MTTRATGAKDLFAVLRVAARRPGRGGGGQRAQVREELPGLLVVHARVGRHLGVRHAPLNGLEQTIVAPARRPHLRDVRSTDATRVHAVTVRAAAPEQAHSVFDGVRVALEGILRWGILILSGEAAAGHAEHRDRQHRARPCHTRLLSREAYREFSSVKGWPL